MRASHCAPQSASIVEVAQYLDVPVWNGVSGYPLGVPVMHPGTIVSSIHCDVCGYSGPDSPKPNTPCDMRQILYSEERSKP